MATSRKEGRRGLEISALAGNFVDPLDFEPGSSRLHEEEGFPHLLDSATYWASILPGLLDDPRNLTIISSTRAFILPRNNLSYVYNPYLRGHPLEDRFRT